VARDAQADESLRSWEATHQREVEDAEGLIRKIGELEPSDTKWLATVKKLQSALEEHIRKEEHEIWPKIMRVWDPARLEEAGRQMAAPAHGVAAR
jgi:hypothetical protein